MMLLLDPEMGRAEILRQVRKGFTEIAEDESLTEPERRLAREVLAAAERYILAWREMREADEELKSANARFRAARAKIDMGAN